MFQSMNPWMVALWAVAAWLAVFSLVRLMAAERDRLVARFRAQMQSERRRQAEFILARQRRSTRRERAEHHPVR